MNSAGGGEAIMSGHRLWLGALCGWLLATNAASANLLATQGVVNTTTTAVVDGSLGHIYGGYWRGYPRYGYTGYGGSGWGYSYARPSLYCGVGSYRIDYQPYSYWGPSNRPPVYAPYLYAPRYAYSSAYYGRYAAPAYSPYSYSMASYRPYYTYPQGYYRYGYYAYPSYGDLAYPYPYRYRYGGMYPSAYRSYVYGGTVIGF
jgi:hypothetical protein